MVPSSARVRPWYSKSLWVAAFWSSVVGSPAMAVMALSIQSRRLVPASFALRMATEVMVGSMRTVSAARGGLEGTCPDLSRVMP